MNPFHLIGLRIVGGREDQPDAGSSESLLYELGPEVRRIVGVDLQGMTKPGVQ